MLAFPDSKDSKPSVIDMKAYKLFHTDDIQARYNELCEITTEENIRKVANAIDELCKHDKIELLHIVSNDITY